jgi:hypothetical protein
MREGATLPCRRLTVILTSAAAFCLLTLVQAATGREDWPLSGYPMYSQLESKVASRVRLVGVSDTGEFPLTREQTSPFSGSRLNVLMKHLKKNDKRRQAFLDEIRERYDSRREGREHPLRGIRIYRESWVVRSGLEGIDTPQRELQDSAYFAPKDLLDRLAAEANGTARRQAAVAVPAGDLVLELERGACQAGCVERDEPLASGGRAIRLRTNDDEPGAAVQRFLAPPGRYRVFLRMRTREKPGEDQVLLELDGRAIDAAPNGVGNFRQRLTGVGWVWASTGAGEPPLELELVGSSPHSLRMTTQSIVHLDQVWLSRTLRELPNDNRERRP